MLKEIAEKLLKQGERSIVDGRCRYRGDNGKKCAVGMFISYEEYDPKMEMMHISDIRTNYPRSKSSGR